MKLAAMVLLLSIPCLAQTRPSTARPKQSAKSAAASPAVAVAPDEGTISDETYTSDYFGFRYRFPAELNVDENFMEGREDESRRSFLLLAATAKDEQASKAIVIMADSATSAGATDATVYLNRVTVDLLKRQGFEQQGTTSSNTFGGRAFARADFSRQNTVQTVLVSIMRGYAVNFIFTAPSRNEVDKLMASMQTLQFSPAKKDAARPATRK